MATTVFLPVALGIVMLGLGLSLTVADFTRVMRYPKATIVALGCQILVLPAVCLGLVLLFDLEPTLAVGMMLLAAAPGGTTANLFSHLARGDVALNVTLTAINSVLAVVTLPIVVNLALAGFLDGDGGGEGAIGLQPAKMLQVFAIVLIPVAIGMLIRRKAPEFTERMRGPVKIASIVVLVAVIVVAVWQERANVLGYLRDVGLVAVLLCVISLTIGYLVPRAARIERRQAIASAFEIGLHNSTLAITIALSPSLLDSTRMAIPAAVYGILMFVPAAVLAALFARERRPAPIQ
jgi:BASS family bile acid:Na+ symporter